MDKQPPQKGKGPSVHESLEGFNIKINEFGEIKTNLEIDQLNQFLNENVEDKKLMDRNKGEEEE